MSGEPGIAAWQAALGDPDGPLDEAWLKAMGFKWHQMERQPQKHWVLWLGSALPAGPSFRDAQDLGIEVSRCSRDPEWHCWLRDDSGHRYSRFIHLRYIRTPRDLLHIVEAIIGTTFDPGNCWYGSLRTPDQATAIRREHERLDRKWLSESRPWREIEADDSRGRPLAEHMQAAIDAGKAR